MNSESVMARLQTVAGASRLASLSSEDAATLRRMSQVQGYDRASHSAFEACDIRGMVAQATQAAARRSVELSKGLVHDSALTDIGMTIVQPSSCPILLIAVVLAQYAG